MYLFWPQCCRVFKDYSANLFGTERGAGLRLWIYSPLKEGESFSSEHFVIL